MKVPKGNILGAHSSLPKQTRILKNAFKHTEKYMESKKTEHVSLTIAVPDCERKTSAFRSFWAFTRVLSKKTTCKRIRKRWKLMVSFYIWELYLWLLEVNHHRFTSSLSIHSMISRSSLFDDIVITRSFVLPWTSSLFLSLSLLLTTYKSPCRFE